MAANQMERLGDETMEIRRPRRIVTGHDAEGASIFVIDGPAPNLLQPEGNPNVAMIDLWETTTTPASNRGHDDAAARPVRLAPPAQGSIFRIVELPPDTERNWEAKKRVFSQYGAADALPATPQRHPGFHKTASIDYAIVLEGEVWALMDKAETKMLAGDVLIQRGTNHAWANRSDKPCRIAFVMIGAESY